MSLLPQTALHSDSEQFIYNGMLEDDLTWIKETRGSSTEDRATEKVVESIHATIIGKWLCPGSRAGSRSSRKDTGETKEKGVMQTKSC